MIPLKLTIQGIGPHAETALDFSALASPVALLASYGTGKTTLLESLLLALYGRGAWYPAIYDAMTQNGTGSAKISLYFEHDFSMYEAVRELRDTGKTKTQKAALYRDNQGTPQLIAGPKVSDFDRAITALVGDCETYLSTVFLSQNRTLDLCGQPGEGSLAERRRTVFKSLIGADALEAIEAKAGEAARRTEGAARELEAQLTGEPDLSMETYQEKLALNDCKSNFPLSKMNLEGAEASLENARTQLRDAGGGDAQLQAAIERHQLAFDKAGGLERGIARAKMEVESLRLRANGLETARADAVDLGRFQRDRIALNAQLEKYDAWQAWDRRRAELDAALASAKRRVLDLEAVPGADAATIELAGSVDRLRHECREAVARNEQIESRNEQLDSDRNALSTLLYGARMSLDQINQRLAKRPATPFGAQCEPCPLMVEFNGLAAQADKLRGEIERAEKDLAAIPANETQADLTDLIRRGTSAGEAARVVQAAETSRAALAEAIKARQMLQADVMQHNSACPGEVIDPRPELQTVQSALDRLSGAPERVMACEQAQADYLARSEQLAALRDELFQAEGDEATLRPAAESARAALADRNRQREELERRVQSLANDVVSARASVDRLGQQIARHEARIEDLERRQAESQAKRQRAAAMRDDLEGLKDVRACFGPRGVSQILIDNAAPELEAIADELFERATGGRQRLRIATQSVNGDGSLKEDFQILVRDERGERDATRFSGGQLQLIQILFRIAVALWVGRIRGTRPDCLFLDEAFDRMGADGTEDLLRVLDYLGEQIRLIVVVTHDDQIAARLRSMVRLEKGIMGVRVITGAGVAA